MTWNLFHGRDWPPEPPLQVRAHKGNFRRGPRLGERYEQVNWELFDRFAELIRGVDWDVALFQECPPRWSSRWRSLWPRNRLADACGAEVHRALSGRNWLQPLTSAVGRWRPDLLGAWEGGSNTTLVRAGGGIAERRREILTWRPELRVMALTRLNSGLAVANLHVSTSPPAAERELLDGAARALEFAGGDPLIFGGDFNVRPKASGVFAQLEDRFGLAPATAPDRLSHLLVHGLQVIQHPAALPPDARDVPDDATGFRIRLSDHNPVIGKFAGVG